MVSRIAGEMCLVGTVPGQIMFMVMFSCFRKVLAAFSQGRLRHYQFQYRRSCFREAVHLQHRK